MKEDNNAIDINVFETLIENEPDLSSLFETLFNEDPASFINIQQTTPDDLNFLEVPIANNEQIASELPDLEVSLELDNLSNDRNNSNKRKLNNESSDDLLESPDIQHKRRSTRKRTIKSLTDECCSSSQSTSMANEGSVKKESNKEAATRYRLKKLNEKDQLFEAKTQLEKQNEDVRREIDHVQTEIDYLKVVLVQMLVTKGLLNTNNLTIG